MASSNPSVGTKEILKGANFPSKKESRENCTVSKILGELATRFDYSGSGKSMTTKKSKKFSLDLTTKK